MNIYDMVPGQLYMAGDSLGYDMVMCIAHHPADKKFEYKYVEIEYTESGMRDFWFETPDCGMVTYVEPR